MNRNVWAEINLGNIKHNLNYIDEASCHKGIIGVVKSDAYGHGAIEISRFLQDNGVKGLAVSGIDEGVRLREAGITLPILVMGYIRKCDLEDIYLYRLTPTANSLEMLIAVNELGKKLLRKLSVELRVEVDTSSMGVYYKNTSKLFDELSLLKNVNISSIYSHIIAAYSNDKEETGNQLQHVRSFYERLNAVCCSQVNIHLLSSPGLLLNRGSILESVRVGTMLYGIQSLKDQEINEIKPVMKIKATIIGINYYKNYNSCGYGYKEFSGNDAIIAVVGVGYSDLPILSKLVNGNVLIGGVRFKISGEVFMNHFLVDITCSKGVEIGSEVVILGNDMDENISAFEMAEKFGIGVERSEFPCLSAKSIKKVFVN